MGKMRSCALLIATVVIAGCASSRGQLNIQVTETENPASGTAVKFVQVADNRSFQVKPSDPSIPSLMKDDDIGNPAIVARAIARKRNTWGAAMGDILLPPGRTVMQLTEEALVRAFRQSGYRVVKAGDADYGRAIPVTVAVQEFWAWGTPGALTFKLEFKSSVRISAPVGPFGNGETVTSYAKEGYVAATSSSWLETVNLGLEDLVNNVKAKLKKS